MNRHPVLAALEMLTAVGLLAFWGAFFTVGLAPEHPPECYLAYESAFPLPDLLLAGLLFVAGGFLFTRHALGRSLSLVAAGALAFLGFLDFSFNLQNGVYLLSATDLALNGFINAWCVGLGVYTIWRLSSANGNAAPDE